VNSIPSDPSAEPFVAAVVRQIAEPFATPAEDRPDAEGLRRRILHLLGKSVDDAGRELAADVVLLASFFQNVDLLYEHGFARADHVSAAIMRAMEAMGG
jgi:hypothetical protein